MVPFWSVATKKIRHASERKKLTETFFHQTREHLSKAQRGLVGDGVSEVITKLRVTSSDGTSYSGDLLAILDVLKNMTEIFRRPYYSPTSEDMRVIWSCFHNLLDAEKCRVLEANQMHVGIYSTILCFIFVVFFSFCTSQVFSQFQKWEEVCRNRMFVFEKWG